MKGKITILIGLALMLSGVIWYGAVLRESAQAERNAQELVPQLRLTIAEPSALETRPTQPQNYQENMTEAFVDGIGYVGVLTIPTLSLELPVINEWSLKNAKIAPCRYSGSVFRDDLILCAHNYDSHFGKLKQLSVGDGVTFTDMDGGVFMYQVQETQIIEGTDVDKIQDGDWDLTLFTCTPGGKMRYSVRLRKIS